MRIDMTYIVAAGFWILSLYGGNSFAQWKSGSAVDTFPAAGTLQQLSAPNDSPAAPESSLGVDSAKTDSVSPGGFSIIVNSDPVGAFVLLDDSLRGESPCTIAGVTAGKHVLTIKKIGFYLKRAELELDSTGEREFSFTLLRPGLLRIESDPAAASVFIDGKNEGMTPYQNEKVKPGEHALRLELKQYVPLDRAIKVGNGGRDTLHYTLEHTAAYTDSVDARKRLEKQKHSERIASGIASALFSVGAVVLVLVGMFDSNK